MFWEHPTPGLVNRLAQISQICKKSLMQSPFKGIQKELQMRGQMHEGKPLVIPRQLCDAIRGRRLAGATRDMLAGVGKEGASRL